MEASEKDARERLEDIDSVARKTRRVAEYAGTDVVLIAWGIVWLLGYLGVQFIPMIFRAAEVSWMIQGWWALLVTAAVFVTIIVFSSHSPTRSAEGRRIGLLWPIVFGYVCLLAFVLRPYLALDNRNEEFFRHFGAIIAIIPMLVYVIMGLWMDSFLMWVGLGITALIVLGLLAAGGLFWIWMAVVCGGGLIGTGVFIRRKWRAQ